MPYRLKVIHRSTAISLAFALSLVAGLALGACAGQSPGGTAAPTISATTQSGAPSTFNPDTYQPRAIAVASLAPRFAYDTTAPLDVVTKATRHQVGATIQTITYRSGADLITAEVVSPTAHHGRLAGVVYAHGGQLNDPDAFLADALAIVKHGAVAIMPDVGMTMVGNATTDLTYVVNAVIAERRAIDVLLARSDVDPRRLAFVGHSWGAELAAIMTGAEPRLDAVAIVCGWSRMSTDMADTASVADVPPYLDTTTVLDGFRYIAIKGKRKILIQYGKQDPNIPQVQRTELTKAAVGASVTRKDYDAGHDLVGDASAAAGRQAFLIAALH